MNLSNYEASLLERIEEIEYKHESELTTHDKELLEYLSKELEVLRIFKGK